MIHKPEGWTNPYELYMAGTLLSPNRIATAYEGGADAWAEWLLSEYRKHDTYEGELTEWIESLKPNEEEPGGN